MEEIRDTFASLDLPPGYHQGAADIMRILDGSRFGTETRRTRDRSRTLEATLKAVSEDRAKRLNRSAKYLNLCLSNLR